MWHILDPQPLVRKCHAWFIVVLLSQSWYWRFKLMLNWCWVNLQPNFQSHFKGIALVCFIAYIFLVCRINGVGRCPAYTFPCSVKQNCPLMGLIFLCVSCVFLKWYWSLDFVNFSQRRNAGPRQLFSIKSKRKPCVVMSSSLQHSSPTWVTLPGSIVWTS